MKLKSALSSIKTIDWSKASVSLFVVKRKLIQRNAKYEIYHVNADDDLRKKLRGIASGKIQKSNTITDYDFNTTDLDDGLLGISSDDSDMQQIIETIQSENAPRTIEEYKDLLDSWLYVAQLEVKGHPPLFSARRISEGWSTKKVTQFINVVFHHSTLVDLGDQEVFRIDNKIDFFAHNGITFIADKRNFESALNFREGMERNRDEIVQEFSSLKLFVDAEKISDLVGNNIRRLRKLSQVKKSGYYKDEIFLENLKKVNETDNWGLQFSPEGKLLVSEDDIETVLRVLNNDRLTSKINNENFDVDVKHTLT